jgi:uncharacterized protein YqgV (UPF0045/DUF77 family)
MAEVEQTFRDVDQYIVSIAEEVRESNGVNIAKWPISTTVNGDESMSYDDAIATMREAYQFRLTRVDDDINSL